MLNFLDKFVPVKSKQALFIILEVIFLAVALVVVIYNLGFLFSNFGKILSPKTEIQKSQTFDIKSFEELNLVK